MNRPRTPPAPVLMRRHAGLLIGTHAPDEAVDLAGAVETGEGMGLSGIADPQQRRRQRSSINMPVLRLIRPVEKVGPAYAPERRREFGMHIFVECWGDGPRVVLVHGAMTTGAATWKRQRPLEQRWQLVVPSRRGFLPNPPAEESDYDVDAEDIAVLLDDGAHLVGHSFGGLVALLAAARQPSAVRSLCLFEPATQALMRGDAEVEAGISEHERRRARFTDPRDFLVDFMGALGAAGATVPDPLPDEMRQHAQLLLVERVPYDAQIPVATIASMSCPKLVVSGDHDPSQERVCDVTAHAIGAGREHLPGAGHMIPRAPGCNELLEQFWAEAPVRELVAEEAR